jgi:hypothetical protein
MRERQIVPAILLGLVLTGCATTTGKLPTSHSNSSAPPTCPRELAVKLNGQAISDSAPNPFSGFPNPDLRGQDGEFKISLNTEEMGLFELFNFHLKNLQVGTFSGDKFQLTLSYSPYKNCTNAQYKNDSQLLIETYSADANKKVTGCFYGKFDCEGKLVEIMAPFSGEIH